MNTKERVSAVLNKIACLPCILDEGVDRWYVSFVGLFFSYVNTKERVLNEITCLRFVKCV